MYINRFIRYACLFALCLTTIAVKAEEITLQHKGLILNAVLQLAAGKQTADGMVLITHGGLAHNKMESIIYLQKTLNERGYNTLAINLSLDLDNRRGMYDCKTTHRHRNEDAIEEIGLWLNWLKIQGAKQVTLLGHSRGGAQTALYATEQDAPLIKAVVLLAPATQDNTNAAGYQHRYKQHLGPILKKAQRLIKNGKGKTVLNHANIMLCRDTRATAETVVSYYGQNPQLDTPYLIPKLSKPTLVVVAGDDAIVRGLDKKVAQLTDGKRVQMKVIDGADHLFRDLNTDDAVEAIDAFLNGIGG